MADHLTPLDATFLELEQIDPAAHMHIGAILVFEPREGRPPPALEEVRALLAERIGALPRFTKRLSATHVGGLEWPSWEPDPAFDLAHHTRRLAVPSPGGRAELFELAGLFWSRRIDRTRPLWELALLEGLADGRWGLALKLHHCLADGIGSVEVGPLLLELDREGRAAPIPPPAPRSAGPPGGLRAGLVRAARTALGTLRHPRRAGRLLDRTRALAELIVRDELMAAPRTSLNVPIGADRRFAGLELPLQEAKAIKDALGGKVNDVVLAAAAGGLRALLLHRAEEPPAAGLRAMVPVNVRDAAESLAMGNRISSLFVELPVAEPDPVVRYRRTVAATSERKERGQAGGGEALLDVTALLPPALHSLVARMLYSPRLFNITITNVPGPQFPLYALGSRLEAAYPLVPLASDHAVGIAALSYDGQIYLGLNADERAMPDLDVLTDGIERAFRELAERAGVRASRPGASRRRADDG